MARPGVDWDGLDAPGQVAFPLSPAEWIVAADEVETDARGDLLGVLVTTGPIMPAPPALDPAAFGGAQVVWVEYIAIAPSVREDCPEEDRRDVLLMGIGYQLMLAAITRSEQLGCEGRIGLHAEGRGATKKYKDRWKMIELPAAPHPADGKILPVFFGSDTWARTFKAKR